MLKRASEEDLLLCWSFSHHSDNDLISLDYLFQTNLSTSWQYPSLPLSLLFQLLHNTLACLISLFLLLNLITNSSLRCVSCLDRIFFLNIIIYIKINKQKSLLINSIQFKQESCSPRVPAVKTFSWCIKYPYMLPWKMYFETQYG